MRLLADESLAGRTCAFLRTLNHELLTIQDLGRSGAKNGEVLALARARHAVLIAEDRGFASFRDYPLGTHTGIIVLKIRSAADFDAIHQHLANALKTIPAQQLAGSLLIIDRNKFRLRRST